MAVQAGSSAYRTFVCMYVDKETLHPRSPTHRRPPLRVILFRPTGFTHPERLRIIPALRGRLEATARERAQLASDLEVKTRDVEAHRQVTPTATLVSAALLLPEQE